MSDPVPVSRAALLTTALLILALVAALAFMIGRGTAPAVAASAPAAPLVAVHGALAEAGERVSAPPSAGASAPAAGGEGAASAISPTAGPGASPPPPRVVAEAPASASSAADERAAVAEYFSRIDLELASSKGFADPQKSAMAALQDLSGDGVKTIADDQRRARDRVAAIPVPAPCVEHHRRMLAALDRGVRMLTTLQKTMAGGKLDGLSAISDEGRQVEADARAVDDLARQIKARYGID